MSIVDNKSIDAIALTNDEKGIIMLLSDHIDWDNEYEHLLMLQEKINTYISFVEDEQYKDIYPTTTIHYAIIEIHFLYSITSNAEKFLQSVQNQIAEIGIRVQYSVSKEENNEI